MWVALDGMVDGSQGFTAVTYKTGSTPWRARGLRGRDVVRFMMVGGEAYAGF